MTEELLLATALAQTQHDVLSCQYHTGAVASLSIIGFFSYKNG